MLIVIIGVPYSIGTMARHSSLEDRRTDLWKQQKVAKKRSTTVITKYYTDKQKSV